MKFKNTLQTLGLIGLLGITGCGGTKNVYDSNGVVYSIISESNSVPTRIQIMKNRINYLTEKEAEKLGALYSYGRGNNFQMTPELQEAVKNSWQAEVALRHAVEDAQTRTRDNLQGLEE